MARDFQGAVMRGFGARDHEATVVGTELLAPHFLRINFFAPTVFEDVTAGPTAWLRFWFPDPDGGQTEHQRGYTLSEADPAAGTFAIGVVLHDPAGPASRWARAARPGMTVPVMSLGSTVFEVAEERPAGYLLIGDSAAIPAVNGILEVVPEDVPIELYLEEHVAEDRRIPLRDHPRLRLHWVPRKDASTKSSGSRAWTSWSNDCPTGRTHAWVKPVEPYLAVSANACPSPARC